MPESLMKQLDAALTSADLGADAKAAFVKLIGEEIRGRTDIVFFAENKLGVPLNDFQKEWLTKTTTPRRLWEERFGIPMPEEDFEYGRNISAIGNQSGKTVATAVKHIWFNYYKIGMELPGDMIDTTFYATLNISPQLRQTRACYNYIVDILSGDFMIDEEGVKRLNALHPTMQGFLAGQNMNLGEIRFANNSVMYSVSTGHDQASSIAGLQYGYISYDEASQSLHLQEELGAKILSRLIKYGCCLDLIATPEVDSQSHQFYFNLVRKGQKKEDGWWALTGMGIDDNRFISRAQREKAKSAILKTDPIKYRQVVRGEFVSGGKRFFDVDEIAQLFQLGGPKPYIEGHKYLISADWGMSDTGDQSVFMVFDYTSWAVGNRIELVNHEATKGGTPQQQFAFLRVLYDMYTGTAENGAQILPTFVMDANGLGGVVIKKLLLALRPIGYNIEKDEGLFLTKNAMGHGRKYHSDGVDGAIIEENPDYGVVRSYYIEELSQQLGLYHVEDKKLDTDFVMAFMMGVSYIVQKVPKGTASPSTISMLASRRANISNPVGRKTFTARPLT